MTSVLVLLDDSTHVQDPERSKVWRDDLERSLTFHPWKWRRAVGRDGELTRERAWVLLAFVERGASQVARERRTNLVKVAAFAMALLECSPLDRRDVLVVAALVRRGSMIAGLNYRSAVRAGCRRAGRAGKQIRPWLLAASQELPATHEEVGAGRDFEFRRKPSQMGMTEEEALRWLGETPTD